MADQVWRANWKIMGLIKLTLSPVRLLIQGFGRWVVGKASLIWWPCH